MGQKSSRPAQAQEQEQKAELASAPPATPANKIFWSTEHNPRFLCDSVVFAGRADYFPGRYVTRQQELFPLRLYNGADYYIGVIIETGYGDDTYNYDTASRTLSVSVDGSNLTPLLIPVEGYTVVIRKFPKDIRALKLVRPNLLNADLTAGCTALTDEIMKEYMQTDDGKAVLAQLADAGVSGDQ